MRITVYESVVRTSLAQRPWTKYRRVNFAIYLRMPSWFSAPRIRTALSFFSFGVSLSRVDRRVRCFFVCRNDVMRHLPKLAVVRSTYVIVSPSRCGLPPTSRRPSCFTLAGGRSVLRPFLRLLSITHCLSTQRGYRWLLAVRSLGRVNVRLWSVSFSGTGLGLPRVFSPFRLLLILPFSP